MSRFLSLVRRATLVAGSGALLFAGASCSSSNPGSSSTTIAPISATTAGSSATTTPSAAPAGAVGGAAVSGIAAIPPADLSPVGTFGSRPTVTVPTGSPPSQLEAWDLIVGTGAAATAGQTVRVQYDGYSWTNRTEFDASWNSGQPYSFPLGRAMVIPGWDQGVAGMKVGGRRELVIPPSLAYKSQSPSPSIAANDTLIFVVDLVNIG